MDILARLCSIQSTLGFTDGDFAIMLGLEESTWNVTRTGKRPIRFEVLSAVARTFPKNRALKDAAWEYLGGEAARTEQEVAEVA